jgi:hypothetical protein
VAEEELEGVVALLSVELLELLVADGAALDDGVLWSDCGIADGLELLLEVGLVAWLLLLASGVLF